MKSMKNAAIVLLMLALASPLFGQFGRDPLTPNEVQDLREARQDPEGRLKLYVKYAHLRMDSIDRLRNDPRQATTRGPQLHDLLEDLGKIVEEMDDNVEMYAKDKFDIRKPLKEVVAADTEFQQKLTSMRDLAKTDATAGEELRKHYQFVLDDTIEAVNACLDGAKETLTEQEALAKDKKTKGQLRKTDQ